MALCLCVACRNRLISHTSLSPSLSLSLSPTEILFVINETAAQGFLAGGGGRGKKVFCSYTVMKALAMQLPSARLRVQFLPFDGWKIMQQGVALSFYLGRLQKLIASLHIFNVKLSSACKTYMPIEPQMQISHQQLRSDSSRYNRVIYWLVILSLKRLLTDSSEASIHLSMETV